MSVILHPSNDGCLLSKASSDAAQENAAAVMAGGSEFFTGNAVLLQGDLVWSGRPNS
jgi:hypothetical protein